MCQNHNCQHIKSNNHVTVILKMVDYCNFDCDFCRYPNNKNRNTMSLETYKVIVQKACEYNIHNGCNRLSIIYHGGEPLLWGLDRFKLAIQFQDELRAKYPYLRIRNSIQTNGSLLNHEWIDFFKKNQFNIGLSIDGPDEINFHRNSSGNQIVFDNIKLMRKLDCHFGILSVITDKHAGWADKYYEFLVDNEIHSVGLCYCIYDEDNQITVKNKILTDFLTRFFERYFHGEYRLSVREFESVIRLCLGGKANACTFSYRSGCGNYFSIKPNGDVMFCDPYTLDKPALGNILTETFFDIKVKPELQVIIEGARQSIDNKCKQCDIFDICGGGCFRNLFGGNQNSFCETFKIVWPYIKETVTNRQQQYCTTKAIKLQNIEGSYVSDEKYILPDEDQEVYWQDDYQEVWYDAYIDNI